MSLELFPFGQAGERTPLGPSAFLLHGFVLPHTAQLQTLIQAITGQSPFRNMLTPGGYTMTVGLTNCGTLGWTTDQHGYCYSPIDPMTGLPWPALPNLFLTIAREAAQTAGFEDFVPDACLINRYVPGARLSLHQDKNERDLSAPIVSVSLGMPAVFLFGGHARSDKTARVPVKHGDVVVWGGEDRLRYHGVMPLTDQPHPLFGSERINFTFRKVR
ncbi:DNA oxidative demethylase AlkB [Pusillimonas sp. ANT_WB101]|uniref:DNA oxidative demethylase AlkB n=1 Tax=Pusillimonas sp. ANT_WB101 TaxID=2597356 RepID=UPI0011EC5FDB|nr:DNA oxidative demethylase AlkB [Pusillimonas sp. ANT_WB101]KAA0892998.1 DNA oxidative demethylase AlkB [Pusillimonas sp. ANT_WB101]